MPIPEDGKQDETTARLTADIDKIIDYYRMEYKITYASVIGVLHVLAFGLLAETWGIKTDED